MKNSTSPGRDCVREYGDHLRKFFRASASNKQASGETRLSRRTGSILQAT